MHVCKTTNMSRSKVHFLASTVPNLFIHLMSRPYLAFFFYIPTPHIGNTDLLALNSPQPWALLLAVRLR